jgi:hypothetical protein
MQKTFATLFTVYVPQKLLYVLYIVQQDLKEVRIEKERTNVWKIYAKTLQKQRTQKEIQNIGTEIHVLYSGTL